MSFMLRHLSRASALLLIGVLVAACGGEDGSVGPEGPQGPQGPQGDPGPGLDPSTAVEGCVGCHGAGEVLPVADISSALDAHHVDLDADGPLTASGYRRLVVEITSVDVTADVVVIEFDVRDEDDDPVADIFASDGRFTLARLAPGPGVGDAIAWESLITRIEDPGGVGDGPGTPEVQADSERFAGARFEVLGGGSYRYTSAFDPMSVPVAQGDTLRLAIQLSAGDIPAGNGWCDFDADLGSANDCSSPTTFTRDITQTATCNGCHGATSDTRLAIHGGGRTEVEYCVTCHNPTSTDANSGNSVDMALMIHKIHTGSSLADGYKIWGFRNSLHDYSTVSFTKDADDCTNCHTGGGADEGNWSAVPTLEACGSCHDDVNFATGENHGTGGVQTDNTNCAFCHPASGPRGAGGGLPLPVETVHTGVARAAEAALYAGPGNGFAIEDLSVDGSDLTIDFSVTRDGVAADLDMDPEWTAGGGASRLALLVGWNADEYSNEDSGSAPAQPVSINGLDVGGAVEDLGGGSYRTVVDVSDAFGSVTAAIEGHPAADVDGDGTFSDRIPVVNAFDHIDVEGGRSTTVARRDIVDIAKCNACHDASGQGISLHGNNRTGEMQVCVVCHNPDATDIEVRPADPADAVDGKREETIDFKRMIHQIHAGAELENGVVIYGFMGSVNDFSHVGFIGNLANCESCHLPGTYGTEAAYDTFATTIDTGDDEEDPSDDLNISQTASVCSSCHDGTRALDHMKLNGASFHALDDDIL